MKSEAKFQLFCLCLLALFAIQCKKAELPPAEVEGVPFGVEANLNGQLLKFGLDVPGYEMHTESTFNDTLWLFRGRLHAPGRNAPELELVFRNRFFGNDSLISANDFLNVSWDFFDESRVRVFHPLHLKWHSLDSLIFLQFLFPNRLVVEGKSDTVLLLESRDPFPIGIRYQKGIHSGFISAPIRSGVVNPTRLKIADWNIVQQTPGSAVRIKSFFNSNSMPFSYQWSTGERSAEIEVQQSGTYGIALQDAEALQYTHHKTLIQDSNTRRWSTLDTPVEVTYHWDAPRILTDRIQRSTVFIRIKNEEGKVFHSNITQPGAQVRILEAKPYLKNQNGQSTVALLVEINCNLRGPDGQIVPLNKLRSWIAVALND
jgi:hypothetical protein